MSKFNIPIDSDSFVTDEVVVHMGIEYSVARINSLRFEEHKESLNFVTTLRIRGLTITFADGRWIQMACQSPLLKKTKFSNLLSAFEALSPLTFRQRYQRYVDALKSDGYFDYSATRIYADGTISTLKQPDIRLSLRDAHSENRLGMGKSYGVSWIGYSASDPFEIGFYEKPPGGFFTKNACVQFKCLENRDVIITLLRNMFRAVP